MKLLRQTSRSVALAALSAALLVPLAGRAPAIEGTEGSFSWSWDTTVSYGLFGRVEKRDPAIIGLAAGGTAFSVNGDDGNLNYNNGLASNVFKATTELELSYKNIGAFVRAYGFYDFENVNSDRARTPPQRRGPRPRRHPRSSSATPSPGRSSTSGAVPVEIRAGWQVINWGESTFIQGGINAINPVDVSALRVPGAELRDALLPVGAVLLSVKPSKNTSIEGFYQYDVVGDEDRPRRAATSRRPTSRAPGATKVMLGFGSAPDTIPVGFNIPGNPVGVAVPRTGDREAGDDGPVRRRLPPLRPGPRRHRVRPLLHELPQPPAPDHGEDGDAERPPRQRQLRRAAPATSSPTPRTSSSSASASTPSSAAPASPSRARSPTAWTCRSRSTTSRSSTRRSRRCGSSRPRRSWPRCASSAACSPRRARSAPTASARRSRATGASTRRRSR